MSVVRVSAGGDDDVVPPAWTDNPLRLIWSDMRLFWANIGCLFGVMVPGPADKLDELYLSPINMLTIAIHAFLVVYQLIYLALIPMAVICQIPAAWVLVFCTVGFLFNKAVCFFLNGPAVLDSTVPLPAEEQHPDEAWIFLNGVSVGSVWLQANVNRLSMTFRRPVRGVHNPTDGIVFDLIQCIIERNFSYSTQDVREAYRQIKSALIKDQYKKVVLILHSQGGIQGSLIIDWLLSEVNLRIAIVTSIESLAD